MEAARAGAAYVNTASQPMKLIRLSLWDRSRPWSMMKYRATTRNPQATVPPMSPATAASMMNGAWM